MASIKGIIDRIRYSIYCMYVKSLSHEQQLKVAVEAYGVVNETYKNEVGENTGVCTVSFQCPYDGHVAYHCNRILKARKDDETDILTDYAIEKVGDGDWRLTVVVGTCNEDAHVAADAVAMTAILRIPTVVGDFNRSSKVVEAGHATANLAEISFC